MELQLLNTSLKMFAFIFEFQIDMEAPDFKDFAKSMTDYIAEYLENIRDR